VFKSEKYENLLIVGIGILYVALNAFIIYRGESAYFSILPFILLVGLVALVSYDKIFFLITFLTPLSISFKYFFPKTDFNFSLLTEPLLLLLLVILFFKFIFDRKINKNIIKHPITKAFLFNLFWILVTATTSTLPLVSFKFLFARIWLSVPIFFFGLVLFKKTKNIKAFIWAYAISLFIVVLYSTVRLSQISFLAKNAAHFAVGPFYNDHTAYGAILGLFTPLMWGIAIKAKQKKLFKIFSFIVAIAFSIGVILSYSRATWIGIVVALGVLALVKLKIKFRYIAAVAVVIAIVVSTFWFQIIDNLEKNSQDSSNNLAHHITSITNISTDASNVERLNRWYCALEMFKEKPVTGWGPGTYQFKYAPFQLGRMRTIISTNFGDIGNSHSEYLGPLAEQGIIGSLSFLWLAIIILITGFRVYKETEDKELKMLAISITLGFITYFIHGFLNNFLDTDKLAIPFFGFASILVAIDLYHKGNNQETKD